MHFARMLALGLALSTFSPGGPPSPYISYTTSAMTLYVDASLGNDGNACTASGASACRTTAGVFAKVPHGVRHPVTINFAAGTYGGVWLENYLVDHSVSQATMAGIKLVGTLATATVATGTASGTSTAASAASYTTGALTTMTDGTQTWTSNDLKGKLVVFSSGALNGVALPIISNTGTVLTIAGATSPGAGSAYAIKDYGTVFSGSAFASTPILAFNGLPLPVANSYDWYLSNIGPGTDSILFQNAKFSMTTFDGIFVGANTFATFVNCNFNQNADARPEITLGYMSHVESWGNTFVLSQTNHRAFQNSTSIADASASASIGFQESFVNSKSDFIYSTGTKQGVGFLANGVRIVFANGYMNNVDRGIWVGGGSVWWNGGIIDTANYGITSSLGLGTVPATNIDINAGYFANCSTAAVRGAGPGNTAIVLSGTEGGTGNGIGVQADDGATIRINANTNIGATTEVQVETTTSTLAALRGASPTAVIGTKTGARVYQ